MGLFGRNATSLGGHYDVVANENYRGVDGALVALTEGYVNDQAIFEAVIGQDFAEAYALSEGCELELVTESALSGAFDKLRAFVKKIWEKVKGLIKSFMTKLNGVIIRDNKKFVEKYKKEVTTKNLSKMKYKWCDPNQNAFNTLGNATKDYESQTINQLDKVLIKFVNAEKVNDEIDDGTMEENFLAHFVGSNTDKESFDKDIHEACFESESEEEGLSGTRVTYLMNTLVGSSKAKEAIDNTQKDSDKFFNNLLRSIDKAQSNVQKNIGTGKDSVNGTVDSIKVNDTRTYFKDGGKKANYDTEAKATKINEQLSLAHRIVSLMQSCYTKGITALMRETKFEIKQARSVFAKAAAYRATNESMYSDYTYLDAVAESAGFDVESSFEDYE